MKKEREILKTSKKVVIKVGSSLIANLSNTKLEGEFLQQLVNSIAKEKSNGRDMVLISSGAVAAGCVELGLEKRPKNLAELQAAAAIGQCTLMQKYKELLNKHNIVAAQVLLSIDDLKSRPRFLNSRNTMRELINFGVVPIVNENDTIATAELELKMGDNDALAVSVAQLIDADAVIILSDVPGLYDRPPNNEGARLIKHVTELTREHFEGATGSISGVGSGGMSSKLGAALGAISGSIPLVIAEGKNKEILNKVLAGEEIGTFFKPRNKKTNLKRQWIAFSRPSGGKLIIDNGAEKALINEHNSLLPIGVKEVQGNFAEGDTVSIYNLENTEIARGISNYSAEDTFKIIGRKSSDIEKILNRKCFSTLVHLDNLVVL